MTPEQIKAKELVDKFRLFANKGDSAYNMPKLKEQKKNAKLCALIAIGAIIIQLEEMLEPENTFFWHGDKAGQTTDGYGLLDFYKSIKLEIPNI